MQLEALTRFRWPTSGSMGMRLTFSTGKAPTTAPLTLDTISSLGSTSPDIHQTSRTLGAAYGPISSSHSGHTFNRSTHQ